MTNKNSCGIIYLSATLIDNSKCHLPNWRKDKVNQLINLDKDLVSGGITEARATKKSFKPPKAKWRHINY